tara:strand:- start:259 stop:531 length:273 start_codon:yes stop_codon:yes gene_type:complete
MDSTENEKMRTDEQQQVQQQTVSILDVDIEDENTALNVMVQFLTIAQKRGAFNIPESAKIYECLKKFSKKTPPPTHSTSNNVLPVNSVNH